MTEPVILYYCIAPEDTLEIIRRQVPPGFRFLCLTDGNSAERKRRLAEADYILVATEPVTSAVMDAAPQLKHIQHQGVGYNNIDLQAAAARGITVAITPDGTAESVSEHVILLILALYRQLLKADADTRAGGWLQFGLRPTSYNLAGKTLGIIGLGRVGKAVAKLAHAFGTRIVYTDIVEPPAAIREQLGARSLPLDELLATSDIVTIHVPLDTTTREMIGAEQFARMQPHAIFINASRGETVDEAALIEALQQHRIAGAGLDVFTDEPPQRDNPLLKMENVVVTPHIAAGTRDALVDKMRGAFANIVRVHRGEPPVEQVQ